MSTSSMSHTGSIAVIIGELLVIERELLWEVLVHGLVVHPRVLIAIVSSEVFIHRLIVYFWLFVAPRGVRMIGVRMIVRSIVLIHGLIVLFVVIVVIALAPISVIVVWVCSLVLAWVVTSGD